MLATVVHLMPSPAGLALALPGMSRHVSYPRAWARLLILAAVLDGLALAVSGHEVLAEAVGLVLLPARLALTLLRTTPCGAYPWSQSGTARGASASTAAELELLLLRTTPQIAPAAASSWWARPLLLEALQAGLALALLGASARAVLAVVVRPVPKLAWDALAEFGLSQHEGLAGVNHVVRLPAGLAFALPGTSPRVACPSAWVQLLLPAAVLAGLALALLGASQHEVLAGLVRMVPKLAVLPLTLPGTSPHCACPCKGVGLLLLLPLRAGLAMTLLGMSPDGVLVLVVLAVRWPTYLAADLDVELLREPGPAASGQRRTRSPGFVNQHALDAGAGSPLAASDLYW